MAAPNIHDQAHKSIHTVFQVHHERFDLKSSSVAVSPVHGGFAPSMHVVLEDAFSGTVCTLDLDNCTTVVEQVKQVRWLKCVSTFLIDGKNTSSKVLTSCDCFRRTILVFVCDSSRSLMVRALPTE